jgi:hypothetical protein
MIVVRSSTVVDVPIEQAGHHWADFVRQRLSARNFVPDEWLVKDNACGVCGSGDVAFEPVSVARTRVTLSVQLDLAPSDPSAGAEVEETYRRAVAHLDRYRDYAEMR